MEIHKILLLLKNFLFWPYAGLDGWMNLTEIDPDEEVQGEIHLQISLLGDGDVPRKLCCRVLEAR